MSTRLRRAIDSGNYHVDPDAVAKAILRAARGFGHAPVVPSQVLVPADLFDDPAPGPDQLQALAPDHGA